MDDWNLRYPLRLGKSQLNLICELFGEFDPEIFRPLGWGRRKPRRFEVWPTLDELEKLRGDLAGRMADAPDAQRRKRLARVHVHLTKVQHWTGSSSEAPYE